MSIIKSCQQCGTEFETTQSKLDRGRGKFCSKDCFYEHQNKRVMRTCRECGEEFEATNTQVKNGYGKFCSHKCAGIYNKKLEVAKKINKAKDNPVEWSSPIAYLTGLITSDGTMNKNGPRIGFPSGDLSLVKQVKEITEQALNVEGCSIVEDNGSVGQNWKYSFTSRRFYYFLEDVGLMPNKTHKMGALNVPPDMFFPFLRGEIDGDGSFYLGQDGLLDLKISSGSKKLLDWMGQEIKSRNLIDGKGETFWDSGCYRLLYGHKDSLSIAKKLYKNANYYLQRKKEIVDGVI